ncbi:hypothetical protein LMG28614_03685 [Paraburkholderia ultramafica]|uniref:Fibronectin type-III domain-containing protein n=1 Tax=Paraburkholderia ultramafica TaxID=1544867 RepID=A0A6S7BM99_9BURK|nr:hypothetical protein LMG28614_03685 [Paraburkholderia ultramafica]
MSGSRPTVHGTIDVKLCGVQVAVAFILLQLLSAHASCSDRPGTPNQEQAVVISDTEIYYSWRVATRETPIYYDIYVRGPDDRDVGKNRTGDGPYRKRFGQRDGVVISGLNRNTQYCFAIRARTEGGTQGCVSKKQSGGICVTTMAEKPRAPFVPCPSSPSCPLPTDFPYNCPHPPCAPTQSPPKTSGGAKCCVLPGNPPLYGCGAQCP